MISKIQFAIAYPYLAQFNREEDPSLVKGAAYIGGAGYAAKTGVDSGLTRLLGARLERHSTTKDAAKKILSEGGWLDSGKGVSKATRILIDSEGVSAADDLALKEKLRQSKGKNFITGVHPNQSKRGMFVFVHTPMEKNPFRDVANRRASSMHYRALSDVDFDKHKKIKDRGIQAAKKYPASILGLKGKTLFAPVTDKEVLNKFMPDIDDEFALMTGDRVKVYGNRMSALLGHLKKNGLSQIKANPGRVAAGAAILGGAGAIATHLARKGFAEVKAFKRKGKLVKAHKRKINVSK